MQTRGSTNKSPITLSMQWKINLTWVICLRMGKTYTAKTPLDYSKVTTPENSLLSQLVVTSKDIPVPYTNLQLNPYPNTQLDLFCTNNLSFQCTVSSTWLTNYVDPSTQLQSPTREGCWLQSFLVHHTMKIKKFLGHKSLRCTNIAAFSQERWTRANSVSDHNLLEQTLLNTYATYVHFDGP